MSTITVHELPTTSVGTSLLDRHPRGRGFGILSRMARVEDATGQHALVGADEGNVIPFDRSRHENRYQGRHRREDADSLVHLG